MMEDQIRKRWIARMQAVRDVVEDTQSDLTFSQRLAVAQCLENIIDELMSGETVDEAQLAQELFQTGKAKSRELMKAALMPLSEELLEIHGSTQHEPGSDHFPRGSQDVSQV